MKKFTYEIKENATYVQTATVTVYATSESAAEEKMKTGDYRHNGDNEVDTSTESDCTLDSWELSETEDFDGVDEMTYRDAPDGGIIVQIPPVVNDDNLVSEVWDKLGDIVSANELIDNQDYSLACVGYICYRVTNQNFEDLAAGKETHLEYKGTLEQMDKTGEYTEWYNGKDWNKD